MKNLVIAIMQMVPHFHRPSSLFMKLSSVVVDSVFEVKIQATEESVKHWTERQDLCIDGNQESLNDDII